MGGGGGVGLFTRYSTFDAWFVLNDCLSPGNTCLLFADSVTIAVRFLMARSSLANCPKNIACICAFAKRIVFAWLSRLNSKVPHWDFPGVAEKEQECEDCSHVKGHILNRKKHNHLQLLVPNFWLGIQINLAFIFSASTLSSTYCGRSYTFIGGEEVGVGGGVLKILSREKGWEEEKN